MTLRLPALEKLRFLEAELPEILIESWSNAAREIKIRGYTQHGLFSFDHTTKSDRSLKSDSFKIPDFPISLQAHIPTGPVRTGECYLRLTLRLGGFPVQRLCAGYLTDTKTLTWPPGIFEHPGEVPGKLRIVVGTDPTAGSEISESVPTNARWRIYYVRFRLVTDSTVATRRVFLQFDDGSNIALRVPAAASQAESLTRDYNFLSNYPNTPTLVDDEIFSSFGSPIILFQGYRIRTITSNLQTGDNFTAPTLYVEEWIEE